MPLVGTEWLVDAHGCRAESLRDVEVMRGLMQGVIDTLDLRVVGDGVWHRFDEPGGVTGLYLLSESHLTCHTYPEHRAATFNLYCCRSRAPYRWREALRAALSAEEVSIQTITRGARALPGGTRRELRSTR